MMSDGLDLYTHILYNINSWTCKIRVIKAVRDNVARDKVAMLQENNFYDEN